MSDRTAAVPARLKRLTSGPRSRNAKLACCWKVGPMGIVSDAAGFRSLGHPGPRHRSADMSGPRCKRFYSERCFARRDRGCARIR